MANPNAPHGLNPVGYTNGAPWSGKANLYHIASTDTLAYYIGDIVSTVNVGAGAVTGSDANGVPNVGRQANGAVTTGVYRGVIVGVQVAPIGTGLAGAAQGQAVNLNLANVPATKANDYYVWVADDPNLIFEVQGDNAAALTLNNIISFNAGFTQAAPATSTGPMSGTLLTTGTVAATNTFPLKIISLPYRVNVTNTANLPFLVTINAHELGHGPGVVGL